MAVEGVVHYLFTGIQQRLCFGVDLQPEPGCNIFTHERSSERLLMTQEVLDKVKQAKSHSAAQTDDSPEFQFPDNMDAVPLNSFTFTLAKLRLGAFMLSSSFQPFLSASSVKPQIQTLRLTAEKVPESEVVSKGYEVYIRVRAEADYEIGGTEKTLSLEIIKVFFPREVNSFALILGRDLWLYEGQGQTTTTQQECVPSLTSDSTIPDVGTNVLQNYKGLVFQSPVFVNGNIHMTTAADKKTPVIFSHKVFLGAGALKKGTGDFVPELGGNSYADLKEMGGFLKGIFLEPADKGLSVFSGQSKCLDYGAAMRECIKKNEDSLGEIDAPKGIAFIEHQKLSAGIYQTCAIQEGRLYCWGKGSHGQLGDGSISDHLVRTPQRVGDKSDWTHISLGYYHTCGIRNGGELYCWGEGNDGRLGDGDTSDHDVATPLRVESASDWTHISAGKEHTCGIRNSGELYCWGKGNDGRLGDGNISDHDVATPQPVGDKSDWTHISASKEHTCGIRNSGELYCWGEGNHGRLGDGDTSDHDVATPLRVESASDWTHISADGVNHTCGIQNSELYCWGRGNHGRLGDGDTSDHDVATPQRVGNKSDWTHISLGYAYTCGIRNEGELYCWGEGNNGQLGDGDTSDHDVATPLRVESASGWTHISAGGRHTCGIQNSELYCWGRGNSGRLGDGDISDHDVATPQKVRYFRWTHISLGEYHTCGIRNSELYCWGLGFFGRLGDGDTSDHDVGNPQQVGDKSDWTHISAGTSHTCGIRNEGELYCWGLGFFGRLGDGDTSPHKVGNPRRVRSASDWTHISAGGAHTCGIRNNGQLYCWGFGGLGQLGDGNTGNLYSINRPQRLGSANDWTHISLGEYNTCGIRNNRQLYCWGRGNFGQLGVGNNYDFATPQKVGGTNDWTHTSLGEYHNCGIRNNRQLYCWGRGTLGGLGNDDTSNHKFFEPQSVGNDSDWTHVSLDNSHTCGIRNGGELYCWGQGDNGRLGDGDTSDHDVGNPQQVGSTSDWTHTSLGEYHTCGIRNNGQLYCWGQGDNGRLGDGNTGHHDVSTPHLVITPSPLIKRSFHFFEKKGRPFATPTLSMGEKHSCAVKEGEVLCWGDGSEGQLGRDGTVTIDEAKVPDSVDGLSEAIGVSAGKAHTCSLSEDQEGQKTVHCWGDNSKGQLGNDTKTDSQTPVTVDGLSSVMMISSNGNHNCALLNNGQVKCWGDNFRGKLGDGTTTLRKTPVTVPNLLASYIATGVRHTCAMTTTSQVKCWGANGNGELGIGSNSSQSLSPQTVKSTSASDSPPLMNVQQLALGYAHSCALLLSGQVKCWGLNDKGQLGNGTTTNSNVPVSVLEGDSALENVVEIRAGHKHTCALNQDDVLKCWGDNSQKQVTPEAQTHMTKAQAFPEGRLSSVEHFMSGYHHNCAFSSQLQCWGNNDNSQLGNGETEDAGAPVFIGLCSENKDIPDVFQSVHWGYDFSPFTRRSWNFTVEEGQRGALRDTSTDDPDDVFPYNHETLVIDNGNARFSSASNVYPQFLLKSIVKTCTVEATANFVTGFLTCDEFIIKPRSSPLEIIGTVITNRLKVDPSALQHGIRWSNIYHPQSVFRLKEARVLRPSKDRTESCSLSNPFSESRGLSDVGVREKMFKCSPMSLLGDGNLEFNFRWTAIDPDCAVFNQEDKTISCKHHFQKYTVKEVSYKMDIE